MLKWAFDGDAKAETQLEPDEYKEITQIVKSGSVDEHAKLAARNDVPPEFLYYFASEGADSVKAIVARNPSTPLQADAVLAKDASEEIREVLADKIGDKANRISSNTDTQASGMVHQILATLAADQLPTIRGIISDAIKSLDNVPKPIVSLLSHDVDELVASPVLEFSPLISDAEIASLINAGMGGIALNSVARRANLGATATGAVAATGNTDAIVTMLENETSKIDDNTFDRIATLAETEEKLHAPMVHRDDLPEATIRKISTFISDALLEQLSQRNDMDESLINQLKQKISAQLDGVKPVDAGIDLNCAKSIASAQADASRGRIPTHKIMRSLNRQDFSYVISAMSLMSKVPHQRLVEAITNSETKELIAIAWKCNFDPFMAETIQQKLPFIKEKDVLPPSNNNEFALSTDEMDALIQQMI